MDSRQSDLSRLQLLATLHYVWGGVILVFALVIAIIQGVGLAFVYFALESEPVQNSSNTPPPTGLILGLGTVILVFCLVLAGGSGVLNLISGRQIQQRRGRIFSYIVAGLNCLNVPLGLALGIFTFVILSRPSVEELYRKVDDSPPPATGS